MAAPPDPKPNPPPPPPPTPNIGVPETTYDPWFGRLLFRLFGGKRAKPGT
jgi:hypothetical protein